VGFDTNRIYKVYTTVHSFRMGRDLGFHTNRIEQKAIAQILTAFDDKIELLQAQNKTLETTAQTIFKEWFGKYKIGDELPEGWRLFQMNELVGTVNKVLF
jgi:restriction endonuclease S subunit